MILNSALPGDQIFLDVASDIGNLRTGNPKSQYDVDNQSVEIGLSNLNISQTSNLVVKILGNPTDNKGIKFVVKSDLEKTVEITVTDVYGNIKHSKPAEHLSSETFYEFNEKYLQNLNHGVYFLRISDGTTIKNVSFVAE